MKISTKESFLKDIKKIKDKIILNKVLNLIEFVETINPNTFGEHYDIKKLKNTKDYYRIRFGDYRIGLRLNNEQITLIRIKHRKDIYKVFP